MIKVLDRSGSMWCFWVTKEIYLFGSPGRARTADLVINSHPLYRLSYRGIIELIPVRPWPAKSGPASVPYLRLPSISARGYLPLFRLCQLWSRPESPLDFTLLVSFCDCVLARQEEFLN